MPSKIRISVGLGQLEHDELAALAEQAHVSVSWLGERAIADFLNKHRDGQVELPLGLNDNQRRGTS